MPAMPDASAPFIPGGTSVPAPTPVTPRSTFMENLRRIVTSDTRTKPRYADCWLIGNVGQLDIITEYDTPSGHVVIGTAADGETEYSLAPTEYACSDAVNGIIMAAIEEIREEYRRNGGRSDRLYINGLTREILSEHSESLMMACAGSTQAYEALLGNICDIAYRYTVGLGIFDVLLTDPRLEDIYSDAPCDRNRIHVTLSGIGGTNGHCRCRTNLIVERREVMNLICHLKKESGLPFSESNPVLETDLRQHEARFTVVGYPLSPNGDAVAVRKHSSSPWTLTRMIANGTIDAHTAGLLSFLVQNRATFLVCGARGAGKSSLLSALMFEFPLSQRILTIEDTLELPGERMRSLGYKVQSMLMDDRMDGDSLSRSAEILRISLRLGEGSVVMGEIRGSEMKTLYESMRIGKAGSSIMGTFHGDSARTVFERVVHDLGISPESFMATDILVTLGTVRDRRTGAQVRRVNEFVATADRIGEFIDISSEVDFNAPVMRRALSTSGMSEEEAKEEIVARGEMRRILAEKGAEDPRFLDPEWINVANEYVSRNTGKSAENMVNGFLLKLGPEA